MNKIEALEQLSSIGSHRAVSEETANQLGEPFGVTFKARKYHGFPGPHKGPQSSFTGVSTFDIAAKLAIAVNAERPSFLGRGFQFQGDIAAAMKVLSEGDTSDSAVSEASS